MNIDSIFNSFGTRTSFSRLATGRAEGLILAGFGYTGFTISAYEDDGNEAQMVYIKGLTAGFGVLKFLKIEAGAFFQWEVSDNLNVLFGIPATNDFDRMVREVLVLTDNAPNPSGMRGLFLWYQGATSRVLDALSSKGTDLTINDLIVPAESWAVIELKDAGFPSATMITGTSALTPW